MSVEKRKKLNLHVKKYFQQWLLLRISGVVVACSLIAALILFFYGRTEITASFFDAHVKIRRMSDLLLPVVVAGSLVSLISGVVLSVFLPQRIAGPVYRIEQDLKLIQKGDLRAEIGLRQDDVLADLAREVNKTTGEIHKKVKQSKKALKELEKVLETTRPDYMTLEKLKALQNSLNQLITE